MSWVTVIWSMTAAICLTLAGVHLLVWLRSRNLWVNLLFSFSALAAAAHTGFEFAMMRAATTEHFGEVQRWMHLPVWVLVISLAWFIHLYFRAGRRWLLWTICGLRTLALVLNFVFKPNLNFREITHLIPFPLLGETVSVPVGVTNPWTLVGQLCSLLLLIFVVDASITTWRRGHSRSALLVGGTMTFGIIAAAGQSTLLVWGIYPSPYILSQVFLILIVVMGYELSRDVVQAAQLARDLQASEARMTQAANAANLSLWDWDMIQDNIWTTNTGRQQRGWAKSKGINFNQFLQSLHPEDRESVSQALARCVSSDGDYATEYRVMLPGGQWRWIAATGRMEFDHHQKPVRMRGVSQDITRSKEAEQEVSRQRGEVAHIARVAMLGELSGSLAHELNQPLTAILSNAQAAQRFLAQGRSDPEEMREILNDIVADDKRAGEVIQRLRQLFKKGEVQLQRLEVNDLVRDVLKLVNTDLMHKGVSLHTDLGLELPGINVDRVQLQQVLLNLVANASMAMAGTDPADRKLVLSTTAAAGEGVRVTVADQGCGIPPENLTRIFEPFVTTHAEGMGFGLAVCRTIISAHHGKLWAENNPHRGASFHFTLPAAGGASP